MGLAKARPNNNNNNNNNINKWAEGRGIVVFFGGGVILEEFWLLCIGFIIIVY